MLDDFEQNHGLNYSHNQSIYSPSYPSKHDQVNEALEYYATQLRYDKTDGLGFLDV